MAAILILCIYFLGLKMEELKAQMSLLQDLARE